MNEGRGPGNGCAPVVADDHRRLVRAQGGDQASHISGQMFETIGLDLVGLVRAAVTANVDRAGREAGGRNGAHLMAPRVPRLRKAVDHDNQRALTLKGDPQCDLAHLYLTKLDMMVPLWIAATQRRLVHVAAVTPR